MIIGTIKADRQAAASAETPQRIQETGAYVGHILQAEQYETRSGATMARLFFQEEAGATAWLSLCLLKNDGEESFTMGIFHSILTCAEVEAVTATKGRVKTMSGQVVDGYRMRELEGKRIGLLLQAEPREYEFNGKINVTNDMVIRRSFRAEDGRTAKEIENNAQPERIQADLKYYKEHPKELRRLEGAARPASSSAGSPNLPPAPPLEEDVPF